MAVKVTMDAATLVDESAPGRPLEWSVGTWAALWADVEVIKQDHAIRSDASACRALAKMSKWKGYSARCLQKELIAARAAHSGSLLAQTVASNDDPEGRREFLDLVRGAKRSGKPTRD